MTPHYADDAVTLWHGDCADVLAELPNGSVDAVVTDPPYGLEFMGKTWDTFDAMGSSASYGKGALGKAKSRGYADNDNAAFQQWCEQWAAECLRVLKPGGHLLAFGGTRTWHRLACAVEDAGFEIRDSIAWLYGSGFPKSLDVSKAIDKAAGVEREVVTSRFRAATGRAEQGTGGYAFGEDFADTAPATPNAARWQGWGTALKPAHEPVVVARKPLAGTVAQNVLTHGTGALNVDGCRIGFASDADERESKDKNRHADFGTAPGGNEVYGDYTMIERTNYNPPGRWPANVVLDESQAAELDRQSGVSRPKPERTGRVGGGYDDGTLRGLGSPDVIGTWPADSGGGASRFFYVPKADSNERPRHQDTAHPTVKPVDLMRWLVRLVTPPGGRVLDPFAGTGTTAEACIVEGFHCLLIEREADYLPLIVKRVTKPIQPDLFSAGGVA